MEILLGISLAKTRKPDVPLRPVIAFYDVPYYNLSKFLS